MKVQRAAPAPASSSTATTPPGAARARESRGTATFAQTLAGASGRSADDVLALRWPEPGSRPAQGWGRVARDLGLVLGQLMRGHAGSGPAGESTRSTA